MKNWKVEVSNIDGTNVRQYDFITYQSALDAFMDLCWHLNQRLDIVKPFGNIPVEMSDTGDKHIVKLIPDPYSLND